MANEENLPPPAIEGTNAHFLVWLATTESHPEKKVWMARDLTSSMTFIFDSLNHARSFLKEMRCMEQTIATLEDVNPSDP